MTNAFAFPILSVIIFVPIVAGVVILFMDGEKRDMIRGVAITAAAIVLVLSAAVYFGYNAQVPAITANQTALQQQNAPGTATKMFEDGLAFQEQVTWIDKLGISYHV